MTTNSPIINPKNWIITDIFISNDKLANLSLIEFNEENLKMFDLYDFILIDDKIYRFNNWLDVFEYFKNRKLFKNNLL